MTMTDPIADMLTRLRNANQAYHDSVSMPYSKLKAGVAEILQQEGYIGSWKVDEPADGSVVGKMLVIDLKYGPNRERSIAGVRRISKPGLRVYAKATGLPEGPRRPRCRDHLDVDRPADRSSGQAEGRRWGSPRLRLVAPDRGGEQSCRVSASSPSRFRPGSTSRSRARPSRSRARRARCRTPCR